MVKVDIDGVSLYLDGYLKENLDFVRARVEKNWDNITLITGYEGDGKTTLAAECCLYLDHSFNLDKVVFNQEQFEALVDKAEPFSAILWDEADELGGHWATRMMLAIKRKFKRIRSKNLYIFLVTPTMFDLGKYFVIHRTYFSLDVYSNGLERGFFRFFDRERKRKLYIQGVKTWDMYASMPNFTGSFTDWPDNFPIHKPDYNKKKDDAVKSIGEEEKYTAAMQRRQHNIEIMHNCIGLGFNREMISRILGVSIKTISSYRKSTGDVPVLGLPGGEHSQGYLPRPSLDDEEGAVDNNNSGVVSE